LYWDFGGGQTVTSTTSNSTTHSYASAGTNFTVRHSATFTTGCQPDTITVNIPVIYNNPAASFVITADTLCPGKPVLYSSAIPPAGVRSWSWNFGNGTGTQVPPFSRPYNNSGAYTIALIIIDTNGCGSSAVNDNITINPNPSVNAGPDKYISVNTSTTLDATVSPAGNYSYLWTPGTYLSSATVLNPVSTPAFTPVTYTLEVTDLTNFCTGKDAVTIVPVSQLYIPTAFTPNNDGRNDKWNIPGLALYPDAVVSIYNRWGEKIYEAKNYINNPWNGKVKGVAQSGDTFVYIIQLNDDKKQFFKGTVTIIR
jgi:gliding motility-associated-like protein